MISLAVTTVEAPDGTVFERELVHHPGAVSVVPLDHDGTVVLVRQYRAALDRELLEIPAGRRDVEGEAPQRTAERELAEEVGLRARELRLLASFHNSAGFCDELSWVYLGTGLEPAQISLDGPEEQHMTVERHPIDSVPGMIARGELTDAKTIVGLTLALRHLGR